MGQNFVWVGQALVMIGHGLPGLIARTASGSVALAKTPPGTRPRLIRIRI